MNHSKCVKLFQKEKLYFKFGIDCSKVNNDLSVAINNDDFVSKFFIDFRANVNESSFFIRQILSMTILIAGMTLPLPQKFVIT